MVPWFHTIHEIGDITVMHVDITPHANRERYAVSWLDKSERDRWRRYRYNRPRREFALCRAALRLVLCTRLGCDNAQLAFGTSEHGKPFALTDGVKAPISFSVSHSGNQGLIAIAPAGRLGVDVEERFTRQNLDGIITTVFSIDERSQLALVHGSEKLNLFFKFWTIKEALIKALGTGFALDPSRFEIPPTIRQGAEKDDFRFPHLPAIEWGLEYLDNAEYAAAIAHESDSVVFSGRDSGDIGL